MSKLTEMDDRRGLRTGRCKNVDMCHNVVPSSGLLLCGLLEIDFIEVVAHLIQLVIFKSKNGVTITSVALIITQTDSFLC